MASLSRFSVRKSLICLLKSQLGISETELRDLLREREKKVEEIQESLNELQVTFLVPHNNLHIIKASEMRLGGKCSVFMKSKSFCGLCHPGCSCEPDGWSRVCLFQAHLQCAALSGGRLGGK